MSKVTRKRVSASALQRYIHVHSVRRGSSVPFATPNKLSTSDWDVRLGVIAKNEDKVGSLLEQMDVEIGEVFEMEVAQAATSIIMKLVDNINFIFFIRKPLYVREHSVQSWI